MTSQVDLTDIRKKLHSLAEVAHNEKKTADFVIGQLRKAGVSDILDGIGGHGFIATIKGEKKGPSVLFRSELDALPIDETIDLPYASKNKGSSHKCGHDGHMTILLGLARQLQEHPPEKGTVYLLFQPAEETGEGAALMLEDKNMPDISPDHVFALHNLPGYPLGSVMLRDDVFAAGSSGLIVRLTGSTAHAAHPEHAKSPASAVATIIHDWQSLSQTVIPFDRAGLLTIIHARIGERAFGTTPGYAELMVTIRAHEQKDLKKLGDRAVQIADSAASLWGLKAEFEWTEVFQPTRNDPKSVAIVEKVAKRLRDSEKNDTSKHTSGDGKTSGKKSETGSKTQSGTGKIGDIRRIPIPFSWSEDFGRFTETYTGALFGLGAGSDHPQMHDVRYDFPDELIDTGLMLFSGIIDELGLRRVTASRKNQQSKKEKKTRKKN